MDASASRSKNDQFISKDNEMIKKDEDSKTQAEKITKKSTTTGKCYKPKYMYINNESIGMFEKMVLLHRLLMILWK